jgi:hypothetical protein
MVKSLILIGIIAAALVTACGDDATPSSPPQHWKEMEIQIETRPSPPRPGLVEVLAIVTGLHGVPIHDLIVSLRTADGDPWVQAIQDGHLGVYRRAARVGIGERSVLQLQMQQGKEQDLLRFPLKLAD